MKPIPLIYILIATIGAILDKPESGIVFAIIALIYCIDNKFKDIEDKP